MCEREYFYVGPKHFRDLAVKNASRGTPVQKFEQLQLWLKSQSADREQDGTLAATFVYTRDRILRLAPRRSEHVACASGGPVLSAGEMVFSDQGEIIEVTNQSTGFCPEPESWPTLAKALDAIAIRHPGRFTTTIIFRRCPSCLQRNIVKDDWFVCELCGRDLPESWNFS